MSKKENKQLKKAIPKSAKRKMRVEGSSFVGPQYDNSMRFRHISVLTENGTTIVLRGDTIQEVLSYFDFETEMKQRHFHTTKAILLERPRLIDKEYHEEMRQVLQDYLHKKEHDEIDYDITFPNYWAMYLESKPEIIDDYED